MDKSSGEEGGMRSGCMNLVFVLIGALVATALTVVGVILFFSFAALSFESPTGTEMVLRTVVALIAGYFFIRVGVSVWRDLRGRRPRERSRETKQEEQGSTGER